MMWLTCQGRTSRPPAGVLRCGHLVLPDGKGASGATTPARNGDGGKHPDDGTVRLAGAGRLHTEPKAEDLGCAVHPPPRAGAAELAGDGTGIRVLDEGDRRACKNGSHRRRQHCKVHLAMDTATGDIRAVAFPSSREGDSPVLPDLPNRVPADEPLGTVTGDGAFATGRCHTAIVNSHPDPQDPPPPGGGLPCRPCSLRHPGAGRRVGRANWTHWLRLPRPTPDIGRTARLHIRRPAHPIARPGLTRRRGPQPHRPHGSHRCARHCRDRARGMISTGQGKALHRCRVLQRRPDHHRVLGRAGSIRLSRPAGQPCRRPRSRNPYTARWMNGASSPLHIGRKALSEWGRMQSDHITPPRVAQAGTDRSSQGVS